MNECCRNYLLSLCPGPKKFFEWGGPAKDGIPGVTLPIGALVDGPDEGILTCPDGHKIRYRFRLSNDE